VGIGVYTGVMLVEPDGTRHPYTGSIQIYSWGTYGQMHTIDGSFIDYTYWTGTNGIMSYAQARYPNGKVVTYGAVGPSGLYATSIEDQNGNFIYITYVNNSGPRIQTITDSLGRTVNFHYNYNNLLTAVTGPGLSGGTRTLVRFHYKQLGLNYGFSGLTAAVRDSYPWVVDAIYYPATGTGYWLNDSDSYSSYGMLAKVVEERAMGFSASSLTDMGSIWDGQRSRTEAYNYPLTPNYSLTDAPTYTSMTETWTRDGTNFDSATTSYAVNENANPRSVIITYPNGTKNKQLSYNAPGQFNDGLVYRDETYVTDGVILQSSATTWAAGAYGSSRPTRIEKTDERGQMTAAEFSYGSVYNQVTDMREYDYGGTTLLRSTRTTYQNNALYTNNHIFNLPLTVEIYGPDNVTRLSRTEYQYDSQALSPAANVVMHDQAYNPHADAEGYCYWEPDWNDPDCNGGCWDYNCDGYCPQNYICPYSYWTDYRGNVTQITSYADAVNLTGATTETRTYDVTGNMVTSTTACCQQSNLTFTIDTQFAYPQSKTRGSASDPYAQVKTSATYDFNTGLALSAVDANGRQSTTTFDANTLRQTSAISATGSHTDYAYDDAGMSVTQSTYMASADGGGLADQNVKYVNGRGKVRQEKALAAGSTWDIVDTLYNNMGQVAQQTRPYRSGQTQYWSTITYDSLGRTISVTAPDSSVTQTFYNEATRPSAASSSAGETTRVQDPWGRERWGRTDSSGRLVEVVEPDQNGSGSVASNGMRTEYGYNSLGKLTSITQGPQTRSFKYDSLGRVTAQKLAEMSATLNNAGTYVGSGTWSDVFTYDERSNLISHTDARGVKTLYTYNNDPLNRLQSVSWDTSGFGDTGNPILSTPSVTYSYRTKSSPTDLKDITQLNSVATSGVSTESYTYDTDGHLSAKTLTLTSRASYPFVTDYIYDSLDRVKDVRYPAEYGSGSARKVVHHNYDVASRLGSLTYDSQTFASSIVYNASSQTTSLTAGTGTNQVAETYDYNTQNGLLGGQTATRNGTTLMNVNYDYTDASGKRTGQLTKILNNLDHNKDRGYEYDSLGRLKRATGGQNVNWAQRYYYDRYGNRNNAFSHTAEAFVRNFYLKALVRQPNSTELNSWLSTLQTAYTQGSSQFWTAMQNLGGSVFTSQEYINRGRNDHDYVYDLYQAYLWRDPDTGGWANWEANCATNGRNATRAGFDWSLEFELHVSGTSPYSPPGGATVASDGWGSLHFDNASNRINDGGWGYDAAGNQTRVYSGAGWQRYQYDAANRLVKVKADDNVTVLASYTYGPSNKRLIGEEGGLRTYYVSEAGATVTEFTESGGSTTPSWSKSYVYLGARLLSTVSPGGVQYHHPDRLGTRLVTTPATGASFVQATLPFGTTLSTETTGTTNRRFTSYDRSTTTGLDYAVNRHYDSLQGRFTQVDPAGMKATHLEAPQTLNLYAYCANDPINRTDPNGLGFFSFLKKLFRIVAIVLLVAALVLVGVGAGIIATAISFAGGSGWLATAIMWTAFIAAGLAAAVPIAEFFGSIAQWINRCRVPDFSGLSSGRQKELQERGVTPEQWNALKNKQRLGYFNITAAIASLGLSLAGWLVDWAAGGIQQDRVFFVAGPGASNLVAQANASGRFSRGTNPRREHGDYTESFRQGLHPSLQLSFTPDGRRLDADLDSFNPSAGPFGLLGHIGEILLHTASRFFGGSGRTNPNNVAFKSSWECK
jgi:RHS repeat-associated protein